MNGANARRKMIQKIRTTIWRNQKKSAMRIAEVEVKTRLAEDILNLSILRRIKMAITGRI